MSVLFTREDQQSGIATEMLRLAEQHGSVTGSRWVTHADGTRRHVKATLVACRTDSKCVGFAGLAHEAPVPAALRDEAIRRARATLEGRVEERTRQLAESNALLATEVADRTQAEAGRIRLLRRLVVAQEEERRRIARDLHDDLGQRLTALRLSSRRSTAPQGRADLSQAIGKALAMLAGIDQGLDFLAWELRPAALDELGLMKVLDNYVREWSRHSGVRAMFHAADPERRAVRARSRSQRLSHRAGGLEQCRQARARAAR